MENICLLTDYICGYVHIWFYFFQTSCYLINEVKTWKMPARNCLYKLANIWEVYEFSWFNLSPQHTKQITFALTSRLQWQLHTNDSSLMDQQHSALLKAKVAGNDAPRRLEKSKRFTKLVCCTHTHTMYCICVRITANSSLQHCFGHVIIIVFIDIIACHQLCRTRTTTIEQHSFIVHFRLTPINAQ